MYTSHCICKMWYFGPGPKLSQMQWRMTSNPLSPSRQPFSSLGLVLPSVPEYKGYKTRQHQAYLPRASAPVVLTIPINIY